MATPNPGPPPRSGAAPSAPVFVARHLAKTYRMGEVAVHALQDVDLEIDEGEFVVLLGPSGSGKSTLLNILGGLDVPTSGTALWRDHDLATAGEQDLTSYRREHVGFVFQFYNLIPSLTVRIGRVGLTARANHFPSQLSGGEQQRVAIARAIAKRPDVLLCDEPTGALDYETGKVVLEVIARVNVELGTTAVVITHNAAISRMADRILHLADGRITRIEVNPRKLTPAELSW